MRGCSVHHKDVMSASGGGGGQDSCDGYHKYFWEERSSVH